MNKRNIAIDYLRILGMLGVLAIHVLFIVYFYMI